MILAAALLALSAPALVCDVRDFGARGDQSVIETAALQRAVDACAAKGGGTVYFPKGVYYSGTVRLKSGVYLYLEEGAVIKGSRRGFDFDDCEKEVPNDAGYEARCHDYALLRADHAVHVGVVGPGTVDSDSWHRFGPKPLSFRQCSDVKLAGIQVLNSPSYSISLLGTDDVSIERVTILNSYADGIDPDSCRNVKISGCHIESRDDAIAIKTTFSLGYHRASENITVENCSLASNQNCFKMGSESGSDVSHVVVRDTAMRSLMPGHARSGVAIESVDGNHIDDVLIERVRMDDVGAPIFIRLGGRLRDKAPSPGKITNVRIKSVEALEASRTSSITGIPDFNPDGISLSDVSVVYAGKTPGVSIPGRKVPERVKSFPTPTMLGRLPAYGLYARHIDNLSLSNVTFRSEKMKPGPSAVVTEDTKGLQVVP